MQIHRVAALVIATALISSLQVPNLYAQPDNSSDRPPGGTAETFGYPHPAAHYPGEDGALPEPLRLPVSNERPERPIVQRAA
jgi:hypothetical protein